MYRFEDEKYCVWKLPQDERYCYNCSLCNFGLDCRNNPIHYSGTESKKKKKECALVFVFVRAFLVFSENKLRQIRVKRRF